MKRLYRNRKDKVIAGVCSGIGEYFSIDPVVIRLIAVVTVFVGGSGLIAYIIGMVIMPENPETREESPVSEKAVAKEVPQKKEVSSTKSGDTGGLIVGILLLVIGISFLMRNFSFTSHWYWWFRNEVWHFFWPGIIITFGVFMIIRGGKK